MANWPPANNENKGVIPAQAGMTKMALFIFYVIQNHNTQIQNFFVLNSLDFEYLCLFGTWCL
jgi:hypothetical protein